ncbi:hypothetical protein ABW20_dc0108319 [Dactylellina cionopaga]|nr:hypothetical protein ABW20_dc0108319 [Dactylellina cionopaga]
MQLTKALLPLLSLASVLQASPLPSEDHAIAARATTTGAFEISNFSNGGSPHSSTAYIFFDLKDPATKLSTNCSATENVGPYSPATAPFITKCGVPGTGFGIENRKGTGYILTIIHRYNRDQTIDFGVIWLGNDVQTRVNPINPNGNYQYLNYATNFTIPYSKYIELKKTTTTPS